MRARLCAAERRGRATPPLSKQSVNHIGILFAGVQYNETETYVAFLGMVTGLLVVIQYTWWVRTMIKEYQANPNFQGDYRLPICPFVVAWSIWILDVVVLGFTVKILLVEATSFFWWLSPIFKMLLQLVDLYSLFQQRPFCNSKPLLDGKNDSYIPLASK